LNKSLIKYIVFVLVLTFSFYGNSLFAQSLVNFGAKIGGSKLMGEIPKGGSGIINEFDNKIGLASTFEISKYISPHWEIGVDINYLTLKGNTLNPEFSAEGVQAGIPDNITEPTEYENKLFGQSVYFRYYIKSAFSEGIFLPFLRAGGGYLNYNSKFKYVDAPDDDLLFGKGKEGYTDLSTPILFLGTGFKSTISKKFYVLTSIDFNLVTYDFLDVVHNYADDKTRLQINGIFTEFKVGIFYTISGPERKNEKEKKTKSKKGGTSKSSYLPFSR
jgi:hypothetical protein